MRAPSALSFVILVATSTLPAEVSAFPSPDIKEVFEPKDAEAEHAPVAAADLRSCGNRDMHFGKLEECSSLWLSKFDHDFKSLVAVSKQSAQMMVEPPYQQKYATAMNILTETLERNTQLGSLVLEKTDLSGIPVSALADGLAKNKTGLHSLAIMDCTIGDIGAKAVARAVNMSAIVRLNVRGNKITKEGASALAKVHDQLKVFNTIPLTGKTLDLSTFTGLTVVEATVLRDVLRTDNPIESLDLGVYTMNPDLMAAMGLDGSDEKDEL